MSLKSDIPVNEPFCDVNEEEAKEIDSCLNFLSILDEETSNDSCDFTLFRKKDDKVEDSKDEDASADNDVTEVVKFKTVEGDDALCKNVLPSFSRVVDKDLQDDVRSSDSKDNNQACSMIKFKDDVQVKSIKESNIHQKKSTLDLTNTIVKVTGKSPVNLKDTDFKLPDVLTKENIKIVSPQVLKISGTTNTHIKSPVSKSETPSIIRMNDNIILKVSRSVIKQNLLPRLRAGKILHTSVPNILKENTSLTQLSHFNDSNLSTHSGECYKHSEIKDINAKESMIKNKNKPCMKGINIAKNDNSCSKDTQNIAEKLKNISTSDRNAIPTICDKMIAKSNDTSPSNVINTIKHFPVQHTSNKVKTVEVNTESLSSEMTNTVMEINNSSTDVFKNFGMEYRGNDSCENSTENLHDNNIFEKISDKIVCENLSGEKNSIEKLADNNAKKYLFNNIFKNLSNEKIIKISEKDICEQLSVKNSFEKLPIKYTPEENNRKMLKKLSDDSSKISYKSCRNLSIGSTSKKSLSDKNFATLSGNNAIEKLAESNTLEKLSDRNVTEELSGNIALDHKTLGMSDCIASEDMSDNTQTVLDTVDFVPINPYSSVEIIKRPIKNNNNNNKNTKNNKNNNSHFNKNNKTEKKNPKIRNFPGKKNSKCKKTNTSLKPNGIHKPNMKKKLKEIYMPLKRTELPTFLQPLDLQETSKIVSEECKSNPPNVNLNILKKENQDNIAVVQKMVVHDRSQSQREEDQSINNTASLIKTPASLPAGESMLPVDPNYGDVSNIYNADQLIDHNSYCQGTNINACETASDNILKSTDNPSIADSHAQHISNTKNHFNSHLNDLADSIEQPPYVGEEVVITEDNSVTSCDETTMSYASETTLSCVSEDSNFADKNSMESTQLNKTTDIGLLIGGDEDATTESVTENEEQNGLSSESPLPVLYSFNKSIQLSFSVQNILENMFKYETFPSSTNMARLAKIMGVQWKDIRDWFVGRRNLSKKNGFYLRNQSLTSCTYCSEFKADKDGKAIAHLLSREHIQNMMNLMKKHNLLFMQIQSEINLEKDDVNAKEASSKKKLENVVNADNEEIQVTKEVVAKPDHKTNLKSNVPQKVHAKLPIKDRHFSSREIIFKAPKTPPSEKLKIDYVPRENIKKNIDSKIFIGYRCPVCLKIFNTEWTLIRHSITHRKLICSECKEVFVREELLKHHVMQHILESMSEELYSTYICFKCCSLTCICDEETHCPPSLNYKHYLRPQTARRSRPFRSPPYSGVNEHLKVTMDQFWEKYRKRKPKKEPMTKPVSINPKIYVNSSMKPPPPPKKANNNFSSTPTYTNITTFNCQICESFFFTQDELEEHLTVHKIQARNRSRKREQDDGDLQANKKIKYAKPFHHSETFVCSYCFKSFRTKNILFKHVRLPCKLIPSVVTAALKSGTPLHLEKINKSNKYKVQMQSCKEPATASKTPSPRKTKCNICRQEFEADQLDCHKRVCFKKCMGNMGTSKKQSEKKMTRSNTEKELLEIESKFEENSEHFYFLCKYCDTPIDSSKLLMYHVKETCNKVPNEVLSEIEAQRLSSHEIIMDKHYTRVEKKKLVELLPIKKIQNVLDESSFLNVMKNYKRVKCKFCDKTPLKSCLRLHLMKQCKHIPEELQNLIEVYGQSLFNSQTKINISFVKTAAEIELSLTRDILEDKSIKEEDLKDNQNHDDSDSTEIEEIKGCSNTDSRDLLYDCHLCEEKFKLSKDFITHMQNFHCMTVSEESACKWLTCLDSDNIDSEEENSSKIYGIDGQNVDTDEQVSESAVDCEASAKEGSVRSNTFPKEEICKSLSSEVIDETILKEYIQIKEVNEEVSSDKSYKTTNTPNKSRNLDEELLDDLANLDNFIETVQLEDVNFSTS